MKCNFFLIGCLALISPEFYAQEKPENYVQEISGTELEIEMIGIPAGKFQMGSPEEEFGHYEDETPVHPVDIDAFWMASHEITWKLFKLYLERPSDDIPSENKVGDVSIEVDAVSGATVPYVDMSLGMGTGDGMPVVNITYLAAQKFCQWLSLKTGYFYRLPTEAEWEYAARAGKQTAYHFGNDPKELDAYAWYYDNSDGHYHRVGSKEPNPWGLYDMYGNVAEWTLDGYDAEVYTEREGGISNPFVEPKGDYPHSVRGGSYDDDPEYLRSAARLGSTEQWKMRDPQFPKSIWWHTDAQFVGFRIVRDPKPSAVSDFEKYWGPNAP